MSQFKGILLPSLFLLLATAWKTDVVLAAKEDPSLAVERLSDEKPQYRVTIAEPFLELRTGPATGYPIVQVVDRGTEVRIVLKRTDWFRIETDDGRTGWASREQMRQTLTPTGEQFPVVDRGLEDFTERKWVVGFTGGEFENSPVFTFFGSYLFTENFAAELHYGEATGDKSSSTFYKANAIMQPMPDLKYSPYLTLGVGTIDVDPNATFISPETDSDTFAQFGIGLQRYISRSFLFRVELNEYVIFSASTTSDDNEEVEEWKFGFAVFF